MSRQETITIYSFDELSEETQKRLVDRYSIPRFWDDPILEMIEYEAEDMGIEDIDIRYSGFFSQGDGLSFTGNLSPNLIEKIYKEKINRDGFEKDNLPFSVSIQKVNKHFANFYVHEKTVSASIHGSLEEEEENIFEEAFNSWKDDLCKKWYDTLYQAYVGHHDVDLIKSFYIEMGECFLEDGTQF